MISKFRNAIRDESGQGMTEYIIIVALIAIAAIGVVSIFGDNIRALFGASADALAGNETSNADDFGQRDDSAGTTKHRSLNDFGETTGGT